MQRFNRLKKDERGFSLVFVALGFLGFLAASMLAIDVGMLMTARSQAQNAADAGALAGATALVYNDFNDRTPTGPAVTNALAGARANQVMRANVAVEPADVTFPNDPDGHPTRVKVNVFRNTARGNPMPTFIARYFGLSDVGVNATATAEASQADSMTCVKPFTIPDRWLENGTVGSTSEDAFTNGTDVYRDPNDPDPTGYNAERDKGTVLTLKADNGTKIAPSFYYPYAVPGSKGAADYRWNIGECNATIMTFGQQYQSEPGNMVGPTTQGMDDLIAKDPTAYWDSSRKRVVSPMAKSPRVVAIPLFDPVFYFNGKQNSRNASLKFVNYMGFFIEEMRGNEVVGRITPIGGLRQGGLPAPTGAFPRVIRLVE